MFQGGISIHGPKITYNYPRQFLNFTLVFYDDFSFIANSIQLLRATLKTQVNKVKILNENVGK